MNRLKEYRRANQISQWDLTMVTRIPQCKISLIENGYVTPRPEEKERLAQALNSEVEILFEGKDQSASP